MNRPIIKKMVLLLLVLPAARGWAEEGFSGLAFVNDDASLEVDGRHVRLSGIHIPYAGEDCREFLRPVVCGSRARLALEFKIRGFVHCTPHRVNEDRSLDATCRVNRSAFDEGQDLAAYLLERGWALALPDAPFAYQALEKIARRRGVGVWGR